MVFSVRDTSKGRVMVYVKIKVRVKLWVLVICVYTTLLIKETHIRHSLLKISPK